MSLHSLNFLEDLDLAPSRTAYPLPARPEHRLEHLRKRDTGIKNLVGKTSVESLETRVRNEPLNLGRIRLIREPFSSYNKNIWTRFSSPYSRIRSTQYLMVKQIKDFKTIHCLQLVTLGA